MGTKAQSPQQTGRCELGELGQDVSPGSPGNLRTPSLCLTEEPWPHHQAKEGTFVSILAFSSGPLQPTQPAPPMPGSPLGFTVPWILSLAFPVRTLPSPVWFKERL